MSLDVVLDRLDGLQSELQREKMERVKLEQRTDLLERTLECHVEELDSLVEDSAGPARAPSIGGGHARKLDRWLDGDRDKGRGTGASAAIPSSSSHTLSRTQLDELRSTQRDLARRLDSIEHDATRRSRNEDAVHAAVQQVEESIRAAATSAQLSTLETTLLTKVNDSSLETASQTHRLDQIEEQVALLGQQTLQRFQVEQQRRHEGFESSSAEVQKVKKDLLDTIHNHHEIALGAVQRFKDTERQRRDQNAADGHTSAPVNSDLTMPPVGQGELRGNQQLVLRQPIEVDGAVSSSTTVVRKVAGRKRIMSVEATQEQQQASNSRPSARVASAKPRLPPRSSSPGRSGVSPGRSRLSPGRSRLSPGRSGSSPSRSNQPGGESPALQQIRALHERLSPRALAAERRSAAMQHSRTLESQVGRPDDNSSDSATSRATMTTQGSHRGTNGSAAGRSLYRRGDGSKHGHEDVASIEYSYADTDDMSEADSHLYPNSTAQRYTEEYVDYPSGNPHRDDWYSHVTSENENEGSEGERSTVTAMSDEMYDNGSEQAGVIISGNPGLSLGERRRQLEEQRAAVQEKQARLEAVEKALGRFSADAQTRTE